MLYKYLKIKFLDEIIFVTEEMLKNDTTLKMQTINNSLKKLEKQGLINVETNKTANIELINAIKNEDYNKICEILGE